MFPTKKNKAVKIHPTLLKTEYKLQFDGCSKGNPGLAGAGAVIYKNGEEIWGSFAYLGNSCTNNEAEYNGLILGLRYALDELEIKHLTVEGDSLLVIKQMNREYKVKSLNLKLLSQEASLLAERFDYIVFQHIYRNENKRADELSNLAIPL